MSKPLAALCAVSMLAACSEAAPPAKASPAPPSPPDRYIAAPDNAPGLEGCIAATIRFDSNRRVEPAKVVEERCAAEAEKIPFGPCKTWAQIASGVGYKFQIMERDPMAPLALEGLRRFVEDARPAAEACDQAAARSQ